MRMFIKTTMIGLFASLSLSLVACESGADDKQAAKKDDKAQATAEAGAGAGAEGAEVEEGEAGAVEPGADEAMSDLDPKVEQAVTVANAIAADPGEADSILAEAGLDRNSFEALIYEIARDPELSKSYAIARDA